MSELQFSKQYLTTLDNKPTKYQPDHAFDPKTFATRVPYTLPKLSSPPHPSIPLPPPTSLSTTTASTAPTDSSSQQRITLTLRSNRNPTLSLSLPSLPLATPIALLKSTLQTHLGGASAVSSTDKIKIILNKKPIPSSKRTLADAFADVPELLEKDEVQLSVMVMGGAPDPPAGSPTTIDLSSQSSSASVAPDQASADVGPESEKAAAEKLAADAGGMEGVLPSTSTTAINDASAETDRAAAEQELQKPEFWSDLQAFLAQRLKSESKAEELRGRFEGAWRSGESRP